jgi:hypothetical protein
MLALALTVLTIKKAIGERLVTSTDFSLSIAQMQLHAVSVAIDPVRLAFEAAHTASVRALHAFRWHPRRPRKQHNIIDWHESQLAAQEELHGSHELQHPLPEHLFTRPHAPCLILRMHWRRRESRVCRQVGSHVDLLQPVMELHRSLLLHCANYKIPRSTMPFLETYCFGSREPAVPALHCNMSQSCTPSFIS